jgi:hypothetical protein
MPDDHTVSRDSRGILSGPLDINGPPPRKSPYSLVPATVGLEVTHQATGVIGAVVEWTEAAVVLRDDGGVDRRVRNLPGGFLIEGKPSTLVRPRPSTSTTPTITASGSITHGPAPARVARASRILVEGKHDAELVEKVWGDDLRSEGIVVQAMDGADDLAEIVRAFGPRPGRRLGVLLDHLVERTKESRLAATVNDPNVLIQGHRYIDIWAAISPKLVGLKEWPEVDRATDWKTGICAALGADEPAAFWRSLLGKVGSYKDLDPSLVGAVESLIDFVTEPG